MFELTIEVRNCNPPEGTPREEIIRVTCKSLEEARGRLWRELNTLAVYGNSDVAAIHILKVGAAK